MADVLSSRDSMAGLSNALRASDQSALVHGDGDLGGDRQHNFTESEIFQMACELSDQGFGEFDVCLTVLTAKRGNIKLAKNALSKVIFSQQK